MSQNQHPSQEGPQNNTQNYYSSSDRSRPPKSSANATRTPQQPGVECRDTPGVASASIFKNSTNSVVHPGNPNGSFVAQGTSLPDRNIYNRPTSSGGLSQSLSSSGGSLQSAGQRPMHFYPSPEAADQLYGNVARRRYDEGSQYLDPEQDGNMIQTSRRSVGHPNNHQAIFPFGPENPMTGPYSMLGSPVEHEAIAMGGGGGSRVGREMTVGPRQQDQQQEVNILLEYEAARASQTVNPQPKKNPVATTASLPEKAGKKFGLLYCFWATEDEIFSGDGKDAEPEPFSAKDLKKREHWVQKGVYDLRASTPSKWIDDWGSKDYRRDFMKGMWVLFNSSPPFSAEDMN